MQMLIQAQSSPMKVEEEVAMVFCGVNNLMKDIAIDKIAEFEKEYISRLNYNHTDIMSKIKQGQFDDEITRVLKEVATEVSNDMNK